MKPARPRALGALLVALAVLAAVVLAACGETKDDSGSSTQTAQGSSTQAEAGGANPDAPIKKGIKTVSIPKQLGNPYEEYEHSGIDEALKELGGSNRISGPTDAGASTQIPIINAAVQQKPDAIIIAGNDPNAVAPALKQAAKRGATLIVMDPRGQALAKYATHMLQFKPGRDVALLNAMLHVIVEEGLVKVRV